MRMEQSSMLFPATIISILHALRNGLRWMQLVRSASSTFSRETNRYEGKIWTPKSLGSSTHNLFVCMYRKLRQKEESFSKYLLTIGYSNLSIEPHFICFTAIWSWPFILLASVWVVYYAYAKMEQLICRFYIADLFLLFFSFFHGFVVYRKMISCNMCLVPLWFWEIYIVNWIITLFLFQIWPFIIMAIYTLYVLIKIYTLYVLDWQG